MACLTILAREHGRILITTFNKAPHHTPSLMKFFLGLVVLVVACTVLAHGADTFVNTKLQRTIDLTTQLARHTIALTAENKGTGSISEYSLSVQNASNLAFIKAETEAGEPLTVTEGGEKGEYVYLL